MFWRPWSCFVKKTWFFSKENKIWFLDDIVLCNSLFLFSCGFTDFFSGFWFLEKSVSQGAFAFGYQSKWFLLYDSFEMFCFNDLFCVFDYCIKARERFLAFVCFVTVFKHAEWLVEWMSNQSSLI